LIIYQPIKRLANAIQVACEKLQTKGGHFVFVRYKELKERESQPISRVLSRTVIHLGCVSPHTSSNLPESTRGPRLTLSYLVLLQAGFTVPPNVATGAVRSYRTFSPLPALKSAGGIFSVALSVGLHLPGVTWRLALWSPDFPPPAHWRAATVRLTLGDNFEQIK